MAGGRRRPEEHREAGREARTRASGATQPTRPEDSRRAPEVAATITRPAESRGAVERR